jgi:hypothetical protein
MRLLCVFLLVASAAAQSLNWEGQSGVFVTPFAYTLPSMDNDRPVPLGMSASYHYLHAGPVLGGFHQLSITGGAINRLEFGYTRDEHASGGGPFAALWDSGFNIFHAKFNVVVENVKTGSWKPAVSIGFVARTQVHDVTGVLQNKNLSNADFYAVATKTIPNRRVPVVLSGGVKGTNASLLGLAGNSPDWEPRGFAAVAAALPVRKATVFFASEVLQQPRSIEGLPGVVIPTTLTYAVRIVPSGSGPTIHGWGQDRPKFSIDLGIAQVAGNIAHGVDLQARHQFALGISYGF